MIPLLFFIFSIASAEEPWGKDADLLPKKISCENSHCQTPILGPISETLIRFHKNVISPADGPRSYHKPNSSGYTLGAIKKYGFFRGFLMGCDRLMRENDDPWIYPTVKDKDGDVFKWDPVR